MYSNLIPFFKIGIPPFKTKQASSNRPIDLFYLKFYESLDTRARLADNNSIFQPEYFSCGPEINRIAKRNKIITREGKIFY